MKKSPRVLLVMGWYDYRLHRGIANYAEEHGWHLCSDTTKEHVVPWGWEGDGILAWLGAGDDLADFVVQAQKPTVDFSFRRPQLNFPRVLVDHEVVARLAAEHYLERGLTRFLYYSDIENWAFEENGNAFVKAVELAGHTCAWLRWHRSPKYTQGRYQWRTKRRWLADSLLRSKFPLGVLAANDDQALEVLEACEDAGLSVPEQVSIIGVDNSLLGVDAMLTPISSIDTNLDLVGYRGASLLDKLMKGACAPKGPVRLPPKGLIARRSSDLIAIPHAGVVKGLKYLEEHSCESIGVDDIALAAGMSRRALHQAFIEQLGRTPGEELIRRRMERAKRLLTESDMNLEELPGACGYQSYNGFWVAFKQATGISPSHYRNEVFAEN